MCIRQYTYSTHISVRFFSVQYVSLVLVSVRGVSICQMRSAVTQKNVVAIETTEDRTEVFSKATKRVC